MATYKTVFDGEWVKVRNFMNKRFNASGLCEICTGLSCGMVWYSIKTKAIRCVKCFTPKILR